MTETLELANGENSQETVSKGPEKLQLANGKNSQETVNKVPEKLELANDENSQETMNKVPGILELANGENSHETVSKVLEKLELANGKNSQETLNKVPEKLELANGENSQETLNKVPKKLELANGENSQETMNEVPGILELANGENSQETMHKVPEKLELANGGNSLETMHKVPEKLELANGENSQETMHKVPEKLELANGENSQETVNKVPAGQPNNESQNADGNSEKIHPVSVSRSSTAGMQLEMDVLRDDPAVQALYNLSNLLFLPALVVLHVLPGIIVAAQRLAERHVFNTAAWQAARQAALVLLQPSRFMNYIPPEVLAAAWKVAARGAIASYFGSVWLMVLSPFLMFWLFWVLPLPCLMVFWAQLFFTLMPVGTYEPEWGKKFTKFSVQSSVEYFPVTVHFDDKRGVEECGQFVGGYEPHGVTPAGLPILISEHAGFFPEDVCRRSKALAHSMMLKPPGISKHLFWWLGIRSVSSVSMRTLLEGGQNVVLCPGGVRECTLMENGKQVVGLSNRRGFVRMALQHGAALIPIYAFGQNDIFKWQRVKFGLFPDSWVNWMARKIGFLPFKITDQMGNPFFSLPCKAPLYIAVGAPIPVPKMEQPTQEDINLYHEKFVHEMRGVFDRHKLAAGLTADDELVVV